MFRTKPIYQWTSIVLLSGFLMMVPACQKKTENVRRRGTRAYAGAPPTIPHAVEALGRGNCLACHRTGLEITFRDIGTLRAPATPHPYRTACQQCHVPAGDGSVAFGTNQFVGAVYPKHGSRAHPFAPPRIPHRLQNRDNCLSCHGSVGDLEAPESPHKERSQCLQCHVPDRTAYPLP